MKMNGIIKDGEWSAELNIVWQLFWAKQKQYCHQVGTISCWDGSFQENVFYLGFLAH